MRDIKVLVVANNIQWSSLDSKLNEQKEWFSRSVNLNFTVKHSDFKEIPMSEMYDETGAKWRGISPVWYDAHVSPMGVGYDIILFIVSLEQWGERVGARGWRADSTYGAIELQVGVDEQETVYYPQFGKQSAFFQFVRHEILHALYMLSGKEDRTHYWWNNGQLDNALNDLSFKVDPIIVGDIWGFILRFFDNLSKQKNVKNTEKKKDRVGEWAEAIKTFEGYAPGTRSHRNHNPGNIKYTQYTKSLGAIASDDKGFAIFSSYESGIGALRQFLKDAQENKLKSYNGNMTLLQFTEIYAPSSDNNHPQNYASFVAKRLGVTTDIRINSI